MTSLCILFGMKKFNCLYAILFFFFLLYYCKTTLGSSAVVSFNEFAG